MKELRTKFTFGEVRKLVKQKGSLTDIVDDLDLIAGSLLLLLSPVAIAMGAPPLLSLIGPKNEVTKACKRVIEKFHKDKAGELTRYQKITSAYCILCYAAFFEAVQNTIAPLIGKLDLTAEDHLRITADALSGFNPPNGEESKKPSNTEDVYIDLPHPNDRVEANAVKLFGLYNSMARGLENLLRKLAIWDQADGGTRDHISAAIRQLPGAAADLYVAQYYNLSEQFNEFAVWANMSEHALTREKIQDLELAVRTALELSDNRRSNSYVDVGMAQLADAVAKAIPTSDSAKNLNAIEDGLAKTYLAAIAAPVIDDRYEGDDLNLSYPKKSDIFIPQAFRAIRYESPNISLEDEKIWDPEPVREDIAQYIIDYLSSPYSIENPMVILGHPGSGKSLLTELLAARLAAPEYNAVRVKLRDVNPDADLQNQIEEQIRNDTGRQANWVEYVSNCTGRSPLVILDGYDELLQASGRVFSTFLMNVASFQRREIIQDRSVRIIVTSRVTLIDKAEVPIGSTILRLEDFDDTRVDCWSEIWNSHNAYYFELRNVRPFELPQSTEIRALARQPLLLLMLALFDSDANNLSDQEVLDQTVLYDTLLKRFILRERLKGEDGAIFKALHPNQRTETILKDLKRLGVAAIGMLNRRSVHVSKANLDLDIKFFDLGRDIGISSGAKLGQAELLLGSFFFVHESRSRLRAQSGDESAGDAAFEFLHNTFGEFLAADWLLDTVLDEAKKLRMLRSDASFDSLYRERLEKKDGLPQTWFATLMATPFFDRPVIIQMLREWKTHCLRRQASSVDEFTTDFEPIIYSQLGRFFLDSPLPDMLLGNGETPYPRQSVLRNLATYSLNLILLRCVIGGEFTIDESKLGGAGVAKPWSKLVDLWFAGLGLDGLANISTILKSSIADDGVVRICTRDSFVASEVTDELVVLHGIASSIGDETLAALTSWAMQDAYPSREEATADLEAVSHLPWLAKSTLRDEVVARLGLRKEASRGLSDLPDLLDVDLPAPPERDYTMTTSEYLSTLTGLRRPGATHLLTPEFISMNAELVSFHGISGFRRLWSHQRRASSLDPTFVVRQRPLIAADLISAYRDGIAFGKPAVASAEREREQLRERETELRKREPAQPHEEDVRIGRAEFREVQLLTEAVYEAAVGLAGSDPNSLAAEVVLELIASRAEMVDATDLLGTEIPLRSFASRPWPTIRELIQISHEVGRVDWIFASVQAFSSKARGGADLAFAFRPVSTMAILSYAGEHPTQVHEYTPNKGPRMRENLSGIVEWCMNIATPEERPSLIGVYLQLVERSHYEWLNMLDADSDRVIDYVERCCDAVPIQISHQMRTNLLELRGHKSRFRTG